MNVPHETLSRLRSYIELLQLWGAKVNLVSKKDLNQLWLRHILDCLQLTKYIGPDDKVIDLGSGAGLPGLILSYAGIKDVTLVEADSKKCAFLHDAARLSNWRCKVINKRIEEVEGLSCDVVVSRAMANVGEMLKYTDNIVVNKMILLQKGKNYRREIADAKRDSLFSYEVHDSISSLEGKIVKILAHG